MPESVNKTYRPHSMWQGVFPFMDVDEETARMHEAEAEQVSLLRLILLGLSHLSLMIMVALLKMRRIYRWMGGR